MTFPILASLLVRLVVLLPFQLLRLSLATPSRWTPLALSVLLHCVVALLLDRKSGSAGMPRPISYAAVCLKKKNGPAQHYSPAGRDDAHADLRVALALSPRFDET